MPPKKATKAKKGATQLSTNRRSSRTCTQPIRFRDDDNPPVVTVGEKRKAKKQESRARLRQRTREDSSQGSDSDAYNSPGPSHKHRKSAHHTPDSRMAQISDNPDDSESEGCSLDHNSNTSNQDSTIAALSARLVSLEKLMTDRKSRSRHRQGSRHKRRAKPSRSPPSRDSSSCSDWQHPGERTTIDSSDDTDDEPPPPIHTNFGHGVGETVTHKLKCKILANRFVELNDLLPQYGLQRSEEPHNKSPARPKHPKYLTIFQWLEAFDIYSSVYLERASTRKEAITLNRDLLTYKRNILSLRQQNYNWQDLDRHFRREQEVKPVAWSTVRQDLLLQYQRPASQSSNFRPSAQNTNNFRFSKSKFGQPNTSRSIQLPNGKSIPVGYCATYHTPGKSCAAGGACKYDHSCPSCQARHPVFRPCNPPKSSTESAK